MCSIIPQVENVVYITFLNLLHKKTPSKVKKKIYYYVQEMLILHETEWEILALVAYFLFLCDQVTPQFMFNTFCQVQRICIIMVAIYSWLDVNFNYLVHCSSRHFRNFSEFVAQFLI